MVWNRLQSDGEMTLWASSDSPAMALLGREAGEGVDEQTRRGMGKIKGLGGSGPRGGEKGKEAPFAGSCKQSRSASASAAKPTLGKWSRRSAQYITANDEEF